MKIEGHYTFQLPIDVVYDALADEALIREALPGHVYFRMTSPVHYEAAMELNVPRFGGRYAGQLEIVETTRPTFYGLRAFGEGPMGPIYADGIVELAAIEPEVTEVHYAGYTDALDNLNRLFQMAAVPVAVHLANRGLAYLERMLHARRQQQYPEGQSHGQPHDQHGGQP